MTMLELSELIEVHYLWAIIILLFSFFLAKLVAFISEKFLLRWFKTTETQIDELIITKIKSPITKLIVLIGARISLVTISLNGDQSVGWLLSLINSIIAIFTVYVAATVVDILIEAWTEKLDKKNKYNLVQSIFPIVKSIVSVVFVFIGLMWILREWNIDIAPFLASLGIAGVVVGFAMQDSLKNIFGGMSLVLDGSFKVGEKIELETGEIGIIEDISIRSTKIKTFNNELITFPNGRLSEMRITNYAKPNNVVRSVIDFSVGYGTNIDKLRKLVVKLINEDNSLIKDDNPLIVVNLAESGIACQMRFWVDDYNTAYSKKVDMIEKLYNALNKEKIEIPFPTRTIHLKK